LKIGKAC
jgi:hypothetical protein